MVKSAGGGGTAAPDACTKGDGFCTATLQCDGGSRNADAAYAEHIGQELVSDVEAVGVSAILGHQQPPRQTRTDAVKPLTDH